MLGNFWFKKEKPLLGLTGMGGGVGSNLVGGGGGIEATGGTTTSAGIEPGNGYKYHIFTANGNFVVNSGSGPIEYLIVGGGGDGGGTGFHGGGGGGGGVRTNVSGDPRAGAAVEVSSGTYAVVVGPGGAGNATPGNGLQGSDSSIAFPSPVASQGGGSGTENNTPRTHPSIKSGGSGGGAGTRSTTNTQGVYGGYGAGPGSPNPSPVRQGYDGGDGYLFTPPGPSPNSHGYTGGGGGGAGGEGTDALPGVVADGGNGHPISVFAAPLIAPEIPGPSRPQFNTAVGPTGLYGGGGGGGGYYNAGSSAGAGGPGGGGGGQARGSAGNPGTAYTGGGGSATVSGNPPGQDAQAINPGAGGVGIVVIRYAV